MTKVRRPKFQLIHLALAYLLLLNALSAVALTLNLWLNISHGLSGNIAATIISCLIIKRFSGNSLTASKPKQLVAFSAFAGLSSLLFLVLMTVSYNIFGNHYFQALSIAESLVTIILNGSIFAATAIIAEKRKRRTGDI